MLRKTLLSTISTVLSNQSRNVPFGLARRERSDRSARSRQANPLPIRGAVARAPEPERIDKSLRQQHLMAKPRLHVRGKAARRQRQRARGQIRRPAPGQHQEAAVVRDQAQPPFAQPEDGRGPRQRAPPPCQTPQASPCWRTTGRIWSCCSCRPTARSSPLSRGSGSSLGGWRPTIATSVAWKSCSVRWKPDFAQWRKTESGSATIMRHYLRRCV